MRCLDPYRHHHAFPRLGIALLMPMLSPVPVSCAHVCASLSGIGVNRTLTLFVVEPASRTDNTPVYYNSSESTLQFSFRPPALQFILPSVASMDSRPTGYLLQFRVINIGTVLDMADPRLTVAEVRGGHVWGFRSCAEVLCRSCSRLPDIMLKPLISMNLAHFACICVAFGSSTHLLTSSDGGTHDVWRVGSAHRCTGFNRFCSLQLTVLLLLLVGTFPTFPSVYQPHPPRPPSVQRFVDVNIGGMPCPDSRRQEVNGPSNTTFFLLTCNLDRRTVGYHNVTITAAGQTAPTVPAEPNGNALLVRPP